MKKLFALLLILILIGPAIALACGCCHSEESNSTGVSIGSERCSGCSVTDLNRDESSVSRSENSALASPSFLTFQSVSNEAASHAEAHGASSLISTSPPSFFSEIPLYLSQQNLRL